MSKLAVSYCVYLVFFRLDSAKRDNDFIYHEAEPAPTALPEIKGIVYSIAVFILINKQTA